MKTPLVVALESICRLANLEPERTARILAAATHEEALSPEKYLTTKQAAAMLDCCGASVFRYARRGLLVPIRRSKPLIRWKQSEVAKLASTGMRAK